MNIEKATLSKKVDGAYYAIHPKTSADMVMYDLVNTVADKIDELELAIANSDARVSNLINSAEHGDDEVVDARVAKSDSITKTTLKDRIDDDYKALERRIYSLEQGYIYDGIADSESGETIIGADGSEVYAVIPLGSLIELQMSAKFASITQEIQDAIAGIIIPTNNDTPEEPSDENSPEEPAEEEQNP